MGNAKGVQTWHRPSHWHHCWQVSSGLPMPFAIAFLVSGSGQATKLEHNAGVILWSGVGHVTPGSCLTLWTTRLHLPPSKMPEHFIIHKTDTCRTKCFGLWVQRFQVRIAHQATCLPRGFDMVPDRQPKPAPNLGSTLPRMLSPPFVRPFLSETPSTAFSNCPWLGLLS